MRRIILLLNYKTGQVNAARQSLAQRSAAIDFMNEELAWHPGGLQFSSCSSTSVYILKLKLLILLSHRSSWPAAHHITRLCPLAHSSKCTLRLDQQPWRLSATFIAFFFIHLLSFLPFLNFLKEVSSG